MVAISRPGYLNRRTFRDARSNEENFMWLEMISTLSAGLFAGAAIYINLVEHPPGWNAARFWRSQSSRRAITERLICRQV